MRNFSIKPIVILSVIFLLMLTFSGCPTDPPPLTSAIFNGVVKINISTTNDPLDATNADHKFTYELPEEVKHVILELFEGSISIPDDPDKQVPLEHLVAGSRTGLTNFTRDDVGANQLYDVKSDKSDFLTSIYSGTAGLQTHTWIVLGYDENGILTHASPAGEVEIIWP